MPSGNDDRPTAFIFLVNSHSKKIPLPPHHGAGWADTKELPGKPDIVLPKYHVAIFVHGCFWHRHEGCKDATTPKTRTEFWLEKFDKNVKNDQIKQEKLRELGWKVIVIWECELKRSFQETMDKVEKELTRKPFIGAQN